MSRDDAACWQAARQLRAEYPKWLVVWVERTQRYRAWPLAASRAGDGLTDTSPAGMAAQIEQAGRAAATRHHSSAAPPASPAAT